MKKIVLEVDVRGQELDQLNSELEKTEKNFRDVQKEADKTSKSVDDVAGNGGAIAILDSVTGGLATRMKDAYEATKLFNTSLKGVRTALIATGVGIFVALLALAVVYWDDISEAITGAQKRLQSYLDLSNKQTAALEAQLGLLDKQIESAKLQGKATESLQKQKKKLLEQSQELNKSQQSILTTQIARLKAVEQEIGLTDVLGAAWAFIKGGAAGVAREAQDIAIKRRQEINDLEIALTGAKTKAVDLNIELFKIDNPTSEDGETVERGQVKTVGGGLSPVEIDVLAQQRASQFEAFQELENSKTAVAQREGDARAEIARIENDLKLALTADTLGKVGQLLGENTKAGKIAGAAMALINTYQGITQVLKNETTLPEPFGTINKIASIAVMLKTGLDAVKKINSVKTPSFGGSSRGGGGSQSGGGISIPQANFNVVGNSGINQLGNVIGDTMKEPVRAFVVQGDIKTADELDRSSIIGSTV